MNIPIKRSLALGVAALILLSACSAGRPALEFAPQTLPAGQVGLPYAGTIMVSRNETPVGDIYVADGSLPPGVTLGFKADGNSATATLSGTPTAAGSYQFTVGAWCLGTNVSGQAGEQAYTLVVS